MPPQSGTVLIKQKSSVSFQANLRLWTFWAGTRTVSPHACDAVLIAALRRQGQGDVRIHLAGGDGIATNAFSAVVCASVLGKADQTVFARRVRSACEYHVPNQRF